MGNTSGLLVTFIKVNIRTIRDMALEKCYGMMVVNIRESGREAYNKDLEECYSQMENLKRGFSRMGYLKLKVQSKK